jgi:hypothetical protein
METISQAFMGFSVAGYKVVFLAVRQNQNQLQ